MWFMNLPEWNALVASQHWVFTGEQWSERGGSARTLRRRVAAGEFERVLSSTYRIAGTERTFEQCLSAGVLWAGPSSAAFGRSSAALYGLWGFPKDVYEVVSERDVRAPRWLRIHRVSMLPRELVRTVSGIRAATPELTLLGIARTCSLGRTEMAFNDIIHKRLSSMQRVLEFVDRYSCSGRDGMGKLKLIVAEKNASYRPFGSRFETDVFRLLRDGGIQPQARQHPVKVGGKTFYLDMAYPHLKVAVEALGYEPHTDPAAWENDQKRHNLLSGAGWRMVYVTQLRRRRDPTGILREVRMNLTAAADSRGENRP